MIKKSGIDITAIVLGIIVAIAGFLAAFVINNHTKKLDVVYDYVVAAKATDILKDKQHEDKHKEMEQRQREDYLQLLEEISKIQRQQKVMTQLKTTTNGNWEH
jgi:Na+-translocating ferredoxin:NAD+ oxidoreductase RnfG subunit